MKSLHLALASALVISYSQASAESSVKTGLCYASKGIQATVAGISTWVGGKALWDSCKALYGSNARVTFIKDSLTRDCTWKFTKKIIPLAAAAIIFKKLWNEYNNQNSCSIEDTPEEESTN